MQSEMYSQSFVDALNSHQQSLRVLNARKAALGAICELSITRAWPEYVKQLSEMRASIIEKMLVPEISDRDRAELAAEARILKLIAVSEDRARQQIDSIDKEIKRLEMEVARLQPRADLVRNINKGKD